MASLEDEIMAGLFGGNVAPGAEDLRRRRSGGAAGGAALFNDFLPLLQGLRSYDFSGARPGQAGLAEALAGGGIGPAARHFQRQGQGPEGLPPGLAGQDQLPPGLAGRDDLPPGLDNRLGIGGPNVAPGNIETGKALHQPQGRALGQTQVPRTQGWLNVAPGYAVAASQGFGSKNPIRGAGFQQGPGAQGGISIGGGGGGGKGPGPYGGGPGGTAPGGPGGPGGPGPGGGGGGGGGGGQAPSPGGGGGGGKGKGKGGKAGGKGGGKKGGGKGAARNNNTPSETRPPTQPLNPPNRGNNNTPSETRPPTPTGQGNNNTPSEVRPPLPTKGKTKPKPKPATSGQLR